LFTSSDFSNELKDRVSKHFKDFKPTATMTSLLKVFYYLLALKVISYVAALSEKDSISGEVFLRGYEAYGSIPFIYTIDQCIEQGYCSDNTTIKNELLNQVGSLTLSFLTETFLTVNTTFELTPFKGRPYKEITDSEMQVPYMAFIRRNKYIAMIIIYLIVAIGIYFVHHFKQRLSLDYQFKLSKLSKSMLNYLAFKTVFKFIYLAFMFAYVSEEETIKFHLGLVYLTCEDYILGPVTFALAVLFAMGYGTRKFKIDASMAWKTVILTACNILLTLPGLFRALDIYWDFLISVWFELPLTILYYGLISLCTYIGYNTYKVDRDPRYMDSAKAIIIGVLLNPFFVVPHSLWDIRYFLIERVVRSDTDIFCGATLPDLIELVVIIYLIYVWRDIREEESEYVELENIET